MRILISILTMIHVSAFAHEDHAASASNAVISITGSLEMYTADDFKNKKSTRLFYITDAATGERYEIHFSGKAPKELKPHKTITVKGRKSGLNLYLGDMDATGIAAANGDSGSGGGTVAAVTGNRSTIVVLIDSNDSVQSCSGSQVNDLMFTNSYSVNGMFKEASYQALSFSGATYERIKVDATAAGSCDYSGLGSKAEQVLAAQGVNVSSYSHRVYVLPPAASCGWAGLGSLGGGSVWINGRYCSTHDIYAHELGHNLGMHHAGVAGGGEYGDTSDIMGIGGVGLRTVNGPHKVGMGWVPTNKAVTVGIGTYSVAPLQSVPAATSLPMVLKLAKPDTNENYYLSYRTRVGYDSAINGTYADRLNIHTMQGSLSRFVASVGVGESFTDAISGVKVSVNSMDAVGLNLSINGNCAMNAPTVAISPAVQGASPGQTKTYSVSVTNRDSSFCSPSNFNLLAQMPAELSGSLSATSLNIAPGASASANISVASVGGVSSGDYLLTVAVSDSASAVHSSSASATYSIDGTAPTAPTNLAAVTKGRNTKLQWTPATDNVGVTGYQILRDGAQIGTSTTNSYALSGRGTYTYQVRAVDASGNLSPLSNSVTVGR